MSSRIHSLFFVLFLTLSQYATADNAAWVMDRQNSFVRFWVNHMTISEVSGVFDDFFASVTIDDEDFANSKFNIVARVDSINTGSEVRDKHLLSDEFFDAQKYPEIHLHSREIRKVSESTYELTGDLKLKWVENPIKVRVEFGGKVTDYWGNERVGVKLYATVNRFDFGLNWNEKLEAGGLIVGQEVRLECNLELYKQKGAHHLAAQDEEIEARS